MTVYNSV